MQTGLFDLEFRLDKIDANGDPLKKLNDLIDWEMFRPKLKALRQRQRKSAAGRKPYDAVLMFKVSILQALYGLSDDAAEFQILDRLSFMRFLGLRQGEPVPDAKTIWLFREHLKEAGLIEPLFDQFERHLNKQGYAAKRGQIVDASIVTAPIQRNSREENEAIKKGQTPAAWENRPAKLRQKDRHARWTQRHGKSYYGYKNHVSVDVEHKLIRRWEATDAATHDSLGLELVLDQRNASRDLWADAAYGSRDIRQSLEERGYRAHLQRKATRGHPLSERAKQDNKTRARIRARVEHVFGVQAMRARGKMIRGIGWARARLKIGLRNLAYNMDRYTTLELLQSG
jgi:IS5 family transposase